MEEIKFNKSDWFIIGIVLVLIICLVIWHINRSKPETPPQESRLDRLSRHLKELEERIQKAMESLRLTQEMKLFVEKKINRRFMLAKVLFVGIVISVMVFFYIGGSDVTTSILSGAGVLTFTFGAGSFLILSKFVDPNSFIEAGRELIRKWIYKKYGFDPSMERILVQNIIELKAQSEDVEKEIDQMVIETSIHTDAT